MANTVVDFVWLQGLLKELCIHVELPMELYCDNKAAIKIESNPMYHEWTKHIEIKCQFIRERLEKGLIQTAHIASKEQIADVFTKSLGKQLHSDMLFK